MSKVIVAWTTHITEHYRVELDAAQDAELIAKLKTAAETEEGIHELVADLERPEARADVDVQERDDLEVLDRCENCREGIAADDMHAGHGMCGSCLHNATRSGWTPGDES